MSAPGLWPGIVVGMKAEARLVARIAPAGSVRCGDALRSARALLDAGAAGLVSFGLAGGLDPTLAPGTLVLADTVVLPDGTRIGTDPAWRARVAARLDRTLVPVLGAIVGSDQPVSAPDAKARLRGTAVDMESHHVAAAARAAGRPLLVIRAIADPANRAIPEAALRGLGPDGGMRPLSVLAHLIRAPGQIPALLLLSRDARAGLLTLRRVIGRLGAGFALG